MAVRYVKIKRKANYNGEVRDIYTARIFQETVIDYELLVENITRHSTLSEGEVYLVLSELESQIEYFLLRGHPVQLERLGSFYPQITATAKDSSKEVDGKTIKKFSCLFKPGKKLKKAFKEAKFELFSAEVFEPFYKQNNPLEAAQEEETAEE